MQNMSNETRTIQAEVGYTKDEVRDIQEEFRKHRNKIFLGLGKAHPGSDRCITHRKVTFTQDGTRDAQLE